MTKSYQSIFYSTPYSDKSIFNENWFPLHTHHSRTNNTSKNSSFMTKTWKRHDLVVHNTRRMRPKYGWSWLECSCGKRPTQANRQDSNTQRMATRSHWDGIFKSTSSDKNVFNWIKWASPSNYPRINPSSFSWYQTPTIHTQKGQC